jgi:predicted glutamine amidotransferase
MGVLFAFITNDAHRLRCSLHPYQAALRVAQGATTEGWGLGFYHGDEVLLKKRPQRSEGDLDFSALAQEIRTEVLVGHVRQATVGGRTTENTHPFRFRQWMGAHLGTVDHFPEIRPELLDSVPDFLRRNIRGQTDSEHLFHLFLAFLHDGGKLEDPTIGVEAAADALRATLAFLDRAVSARGGRESPFNVVFTNGRVLLASRRGFPLSVVRRTGMAECAVCTTESRALGRKQPVGHEHLKSVLLLSRREPPAGNGWEETPDESLVLVDRDLGIRIAPLKAP